MKGLERGVMLAVILIVAMLFLLGAVYYMKFGVENIKFPTDVSMIDLFNEMKR